MLVIVSAVEQWLPYPYLHLAYIRSNFQILLSQTSWYVFLLKSILCYFEILIYVEIIPKIY